MSEVNVLPLGELGRGFIPPQFLPPGKNEYYLRNEQNPKAPTYWRRLRADEIGVLKNNANTCPDWSDVLVADPFEPSLVRKCEFSGLIRIGRLEQVALEHHDLQVPAGITNSRIVSCDIGDNAAIHHVRYLAHYIIGDRCILLNVDEMHTTNHAKFGNGVVKDGEPESVRVWMEVINEGGGRAVMPFDGMIAADAYLWAKYRDDSVLQKKLGEMTQRHVDSRRGYYGTVGAASVIKSCRILKDVKIGAACYIKGANKLKNLTINSSDEEPTQIGEGVELVNGIVGYGCHIFYGCKAVRFVMGNNANLKYGARLLHSLLGDNSTVSCCEMLNNLVFPAHEQHHNDSFLIAALVKGQSNIAAGTTIGSNHNSRANDGEIQAGRGFWPGLCVSLKHSSRFASFVLLVKGDYPYELDIPFPFSLVSNEAARDRLAVMPAYWWMHNMYGLVRNSWKFQSRDKRTTKVQHVVFDPLAPDTAEEMFSSIRLLEMWTAKAHLRLRKEAASPESEEELRRMGRAILCGPDGAKSEPEVWGEGIEHSGRCVVIIKARQGYHAYLEMLHYYAVKDLVSYLETNPAATLASMCADLSGERERVWVNLGGQLVGGQDLGRVVARIRSGELRDWSSIHASYSELWEQYPRAMRRHAFATLKDLVEGQAITPRQWGEALDSALRTQEFVCQQVYETRRKDFESPARLLTFLSPEEMSATIGTAEDNPLVHQVRQETEAFRRSVARIRARG
jgi:hypothetical protein